MRVYQLRCTRSFAAVNLSLGSGRFTSNCESDSRKAIIDNLRAANIATVVAAGNNGFADAVGAPAVCLQPRGYRNPAERFVRRLVCVTV